jgi:hypothetical protein
MIVESDLLVRSPRLSLHYIHVVHFGQSRRGATCWPEKFVASSLEWREGREEEKEEEEEVCETSPMEWGNIMFDNLEAKLGDGVTHVALFGTCARVPDCRHHLLDAPSRCLAREGRASLFCFVRGGHHLTEMVWSSLAA